MFANSDINVNTFQIGRSSEDQIDFTIVDTWLAAGSNMVLSPGITFLLTCWHDLTAFSRQQHANVALSSQRRMRAEADFVDHFAVRLPYSGRSRRAQQGVRVRSGFRLVEEHIPGREGDQVAEEERRDGRANDERSAHSASQPARRRCKD